MSDHFTVISQILSGLDRGHFVNDEKLMVENLQNDKAKTSLRFLFLVDQKLKH